VGNIAGLVIVAVAALWAPNVAKYDSIVKYFQELLSYMTPPIVTIFVLGLFWKRANSKGAFAGLVTGFLMAAFFIFFKDISPLKNIHFLYAAPIVFSITSLVVIVVSLLTPAEMDENRLKYVWTRKIFKEETLELKGVPWYKNFRVLSIILLVITLIFFIIWR
jgi:SSS family solute:Na+ symporter